MKRVQYSSYFTQYFFIAPQLAIILIFLYLPIVQTFTDDHIKKIDEKVDLKEKEIMTI